jgi:hypothetical protein
MEEHTQMKMELNIHVGRVDGADVEYKSRDLKDALRFLQHEDHEGSSVDIQIIARGEHAYEILRTLQMLERSVS